MKRALLPLNALRAFDAAARHTSFKLAADELAVTPAAVSQQVRSLEEYLGVALFRRTRRALVLTPNAEKALPALQNGFKGFEEAVKLLQAADSDNTLKISVSPSFASKWLVPRLGDFYEVESEAIVKVDASMHLVDFNQEEVDVAIRYGGGNYPGLYVEELLREEVVPVCSPDLIADESAIADVVDLAKTTLIHDDSSLEDESCPTWEMWLRAAGSEMADGQRGLHFNQSQLAIEAAVAGRGVALAKRMLAEADLQSGRLVRPFEESQEVGFAYYIVCPEDRLESGKVLNFVAWLRDEAAES